jgi:trans-aconitate 2-methyltransferase
MDWSARQYTKFEDERSRPARDLIARIPNPDVRTAVDLGCGPGNSTEALLARYPGARVTGVDTSPDMLETAAARLPHVAFERADIAAWSGAARYDVLLANASLQWVPDHAGLFPRLIDRLKPGGSLAVQMPDNLDEPSHRLMREVAAAGPWRALLADAGAARAERHPAGWYHAMLRDRAAVDIWRTTYFHALAGPDAIVEWLKGTGLRPYLAPLDEAQASAFLAAYRAAVAAAYPALADGTVLLPFPRLFIVATT